MCLCWCATARALSALRGAAEEGRNHSSETEYIKRRTGDDDECSCDNGEQTEWTQRDAWTGAPPPPPLPSELKFPACFLPPFFLSTAYFLAHALVRGRGRGLRSRATPRRGCCLSVCLSAGAARRGGGVEGAPLLSFFHSALPRRIDLLGHHCNERLRLWSLLRGLDDDNGPIDPAALRPKLTDGPRSGRTDHSD